MLSGTHLRASQREQAPGGHDNLCAGRPSFARRGGSRRQLDLSAHTWRWAHRETKRREMPNVQQGSYIPPGADNNQYASHSRCEARGGCIGAFATRAVAASEQKCNEARSTHETIPQPSPQPNPEPHPRSNRRSLRNSVSFAQLW